MISRDLLNKYPIISDQLTVSELRVLLNELDRVLQKGVEGDIVELGCYEGTSALFIQRILQACRSNKRLYLYDSFEGLPEKGDKDQSPAGEQFKAGELHASKSKLINNFRHAGLRLPVIKKAWFSDLASEDLPDKIAFAFLDGDFYSSIIDSLKLVWPKLNEGAIIVVDDYGTEALPGVRRAVETWAQHHKFSLRSEASLAIIKKAGC